MLLYVQQQQELLLLMLLLSGVQQLQHEGYAASPLLLQKDRGDISLLQVVRHWRGVCAVAAAAAAAALSSKLPQ